MVRSSYFCLAVHAERLDFPPVWERVTAFLAKWLRLDRSVTVFVCPVRAARSGADLGPRLDWLRERGCEIGQHTHFYSKFEYSLGEIQKETLLTPENIRRCLNEDLEYLVGSGNRPHGFTSGAWVNDPSVLEWLLENGFTYDCSVRSFELPYDVASAGLGATSRLPHHENGILRIPTTETLAGFYRRFLKGSSLTVGNSQYDLVYLHDTDLLATRKRWLLSMLPTVLGGRAESVTGRQLVTVIEKEIGRGGPEHEDGK